MSDDPLDRPLGMSDANFEAEQAILGAMILEPDRIPQIKTHISVTDFYRDSHQHIFSAMIDLHNSKKPVDAISLAEELKYHGKLEICGGFTSIMKLMDMVPLVPHIEHYIDIAKRYSFRRNAMSIMRKRFGELGTVEDSDEPAAIVAELRTDLEQLVKNEWSGVSTLCGEACNAALDEIEAMATNPKKYPRRGTGLDAVDEHIWRLKPGENTVVGAIPGFGKSAFAHQVSVRWANVYHVPVGIWSGEMTKEGCMIRMVSTYTGIDSRRIESWHTLSQAEKLKIKGARMFFDKLPIHFAPSGNASVTSCASTIRAMTDQHGIELWIIDHIGHLQSDRYRNSKTQEVGHVSDTLKDVALSTKIPMMILSPLNRDLFKRENKRPNAGDLRDSGNIYSNAGNVMFIHRPAMFDRKLMTDNKNQPETAEIIIDKVRFGVPGIVKVGWIGKTTQFVNIDKEGNYHEDAYEQSFEDMSFDEWAE